LGAAKIRDWLDANGQEEYARSGIYPGSIILLNCPFTRPPKEKFLIVLGSNETNCGVFVISSRIPTFAAARDDLTNSQVVVDAAQHAFLAYDSYADCSKVIIVSRDNILAQVKADLTRLKGPLSDDVRDRILKVVGESRILPLEDKERIAQHFEEQRRRRSEGEAAKAAPPPA
jgi:hypothetical protein